MNERNKKILASLIKRISDPRSKPKPPLPYHERKEIWENQICEFVLRHKFFEGNFAEFVKEFKEGKIPKDMINKINSAMRREKNERKKKT